MQDRQTQGENMKRKTCALMALFCLYAASTVAGDVYKCVGSDGSLSYQARPCGQGQAESTVTIRNAPPPPVAVPAQPELSAESRDRALDYMNRLRSSAPPAAPPKARPAPPVKSYKCTADNGFVFYQHDACPSTIDIGKGLATDGFGRPMRYVTNVKGEEITRAEACVQIYKVTASSRDGSHLDQRVSSYDKNLGRDRDCKDY